MAAVFNVAFQYFEPLLKSPLETVDSVTVIDRAMQFVCNQEPSIYAFPTEYALGFAVGYNPILEMSVQHFADSPTRAAVISDYLAKNRQWVLVSGTRPYQPDIPSGHITGFLWKRMREIREFLVKYRFVAPGTSYTDMIPVAAGFIAAKKFNGNFGPAFQMQMHNHGVEVGRGFAIAALTTFAKANPNIDLSELLDSIPPTSSSWSPDGYPSLIWSM